MGTTPAMITTLNHWPLLATTEPESCRASSPDRRRGPIAVDSLLAELVQVQFTTDTFNAPATLHRDCSLEAYLEDAVLPGNDLRCASTNDCGTRKPSRPRTASSYLQQPRSRS
uniref:(northern house mosquito) hypothetical protein n=1 Tax=Culex pipiens TaxID=7175 RepID=A0A8D8I5L4_CULPI